MMVELAALSLDQLQQLRQSIGEELQVITNNFGNLKLAHSRYVQALEAVSDIKPESQGKTVMVPLTSSLYVPGTLEDVDKVLVDIGTGYFAEKPISGAKIYIQSKLDFLSKSMEKIGVAIVNKKRDLDAVTVLLQTKMSRLQELQRQNLDKVKNLS